MSTDRARQIEYIKENGGESNIRKRVLSMLDKHGDDWLSDNQIDDIFHAEARLQEMQERVNAENRARTKVLADARHAELREKVRELSRTMQCNCDLDNWQPEPSTGHSHVCRIHRAAVRP